MRYGYAAMAAVLLVAATAVGAGETYVGKALAGIQSADPAMMQKSIADLRAAGPGGLAAVLAVYDSHPDAKLLPTIDAVAGQRGAVVSRLYWYTDLATAEAAAKPEHKPILYLRLMGKLTDEYSCANSRFFRTVLYSNQTVSKMLRENFVLVWVSERPVPVVTIDYGDGHVLKRTLTGNSVHYVLDCNGQVYDALPGLFDPVAFARIANEAGQAARWGMDRGKYFGKADDAILQQWKSDASRASVATAAGDDQNQQAGDKPDAAAAMPRAICKYVAEAPLLRQISPQLAAELDQAIDAAGDAAWKKIAALHAAESMLDAQSIAVIKSQNPAAYADPSALNRTVEQFQKTIAEDSVRDNYKMRKQALAWLTEAKTPMALDDLNRWVYSELFLTPRSDPWLGLLPRGMYTALTDDGCCAAPAATATASR